MKFLNPFHHLEPRKSDSFAEMMQGAFWSMITIALIQFLVVTCAVLTVLTHEKLICQ